MSEIRYRRSNEADRPAIISLYEKCFGESKEVSRWKWQYEDDRARPIIIVAEASGEIVGHYAVLPRWIRIGDRRVKAGLVVDVMTHPEFGRRGIFTESAMNAFSASRDSGVELLIGFPNEAAIRGHRRVGWSEVGYVRVYVCPLSMEKIVAKLRIGARIPRGVLKLVDLSIDAISRLMLSATISDFEIDDISSEEFIGLRPSIQDVVTETLSGGRIGNSRDCEWLAWRVDDVPGSYRVLVIRRRSTGKAEGYAVLKFRRLRGIDVCVVLDFVVPPANRGVANELLKVTIQKARSSNCDACLLFGNLASKTGRSYKRMLIMPTPKRMRFIVRSLSSRQLQPELLDINNWYIEAIDHDIL